LVLHTYVLRVQYSCDVVLVFWFWQEIVFDVTYVLSVQYSCAVVSRGRIRLGSKGLVPSDLGSDPGPGTETLEPISFWVWPHSRQKKKTSLVVAPQHVSSKMQ
jgi:hypothetical protein